MKGTMNSIATSKKRGTKGEGSLSKLLPKIKIFKENNRHEKHNRTYIVINPNKSQKLISGLNSRKESSRVHKTRPNSPEKYDGVLPGRRSHANTISNASAHQRN